MCGTGKLWTAYQNLDSVQGCQWTEDSRWRPGKRAREIQAATDLMVDQDFRYIYKRFLKEESQGYTYAASRRDHDIAWEEERTMIKGLNFILRRFEHPRKANNRWRSQRRREAEFVQGMAGATRNRKFLELLVNFSHNGSHNYWYIAHLRHYKWDGFFGEREIEPDLILEW